MVKKLLILTLILISSSFANAQPGMPLGIGGRILIDDMPVGGITVQVENLNTGEVKTTTTAYDTPHTKCGYYTVALTGQNDDVIKVTVTYGNTYSNTIVVDTSQVTQFCNLSISTEEPPDDPPNGGSGTGGNGDEPDEPPYEPPEEPDDPINNETEEPSENNTDNDIRNLYNLTVEVVDNTTGPISNASVTIYDNNETKITKSYTNETGEAVFLLEEGIYIIEIEKNNHPVSYHTVSLLASMEYIAYMSTDENSGNIPCPCQQTGFPVIYIIIVIVIVVVAVIIFYYRRQI